MANKAAIPYQPGYILTPLGLIAAHSVKRYSKHITVWTMLFKTCIPLLMALASIATVTGKSVDITFDANEQTGLEVIRNGQPVANGWFDVQLSGLGKIKKQNAKADPASIKRWTVRTRKVQHGRPMMEADVSPMTAFLHPWIKT